MANPCGNVHMPNMPCRECDRIRKQTDEKPVLPSIQVAGRDAASGGDLHDEPKRPGLEQGSKPDRLAVAREVLSDADRQRRFREKDPEAYRKWNRERMRRKRQEKRDGET